MDARCDTGDGVPQDAADAASGVSPRPDRDGDAIGVMLAIGALMATVIAVATGIGGGSRWTALIVVAVWVTTSLVGELLERVVPRPLGGGPGPE